MWSRFLSATHCVDSVSLYVAHRCLLSWLCLLPAVPLSIPGVKFCHTRCLILFFQLTLCHLTHITATHWHGPESCQLSYCFSLEWFCVIPGITLPLIFVAQYHFKHPTSAHCWVGGCVLLCFPLLLIGVTPYSLKYFTVSHCVGLVSHRCSTCAFRVVSHNLSFLLTLT